MYIVLICSLFNPVTVIKLRSPTDRRILLASILWFHHQNRTNHTAISYHLTSNVCADYILVPHRSDPGFDGQDMFWSRGYPAASYIDHERSHRGSKEHGGITFKIDNLVVVESGRHIFGCVLMVMGTIFIANVVCAAAGWTGRWQR